MTETTLQEIEEPITVTPDKKMHILVCYDESTGGRTLPLDRHLQLMYRRLGSQIHRHYFCYRTITEPKPYTGEYFKEQQKKEREEYEQQLKDYNSRRSAMSQFLQQDRLLIILYVSNGLMEHLWKDMDQDPQLKSLLTNPNHRIAPVLVTPTAGFAGNCEPLCAYDGVAFEVACQQVTTNLETIARDYFGSDLESPAVTPFTLLTSPSAINVSLPSATDQTVQTLAGLLGPIQTMFEQTSARIVESQQLALAERSQREVIQASEADLRRQIEQMDERLRVMQKEQNTGLLTKFGRRLGILSSK